MASLDPSARWVPWALTAIAVAAAIAGWTRSPTPADAVTRTSTATPAPELRPSVMDAGADPLSALAACASRLRRVREALREDEDTTPSLRAWALDDDAGVGEEARACLRRPEVAARALLEARRRHDANRTEERAERMRSVRSGLADSLGISEEDVDWMSSYVCAVREMRADTLEQLGAGEVPSREAFERLSEERAAALTDVRERLGEERYASFREVGGVGMLADVMDCEGS